MPEGAPKIKRYGGHASQHGFAGIESVGRKLGPVAEELLAKRGFWKDKMPLLDEFIDNNLHRGNLEKYGEPQRAQIEAGLDGDIESVLDRISVQLERDMLKTVTKKGGVPQTVDRRRRKLVNAREGMLARTKKRVGYVVGDILGDTSKPDSRSQIEAESLQLRLRDCERLLVVEREITIRQREIARITQGLKNPKKAKKRGKDATVILDTPPTEIQSDLWPKDQIQALDADIIKLDGEYDNLLRSVGGENVAQGKKVFKAFKYARDGQTMLREDREGWHALVRYELKEEAKRVEFRRMQELAFKVAEERRKVADGQGTGDI